MVFQSTLHSRYEDQYRQMLHTDENVVNMFTSCMSMCMNLWLDFQSGHECKVI